MNGGDPEGPLAVARAAIDAREFAVARGALAPLLAQPTQRVAQLMAELEEADTGNIGRAREWMARALNAARDPAWTADGLVSDKWMPVSPATGKLDAFAWKVPVSDLNPPARVIESGEPAPAAAPAPAPPAPPAADTSAVPLPPHDADEDAPEVDGPASRAAGRTLPATIRREPRPADTVIPLVHAPDDPGPEEAALAEDPAPEPPEGEARRSWRDLFR